MPSTSAVTALKRLPSIDAFRALNMLLMIFVNDLESVKALPDWIDHAKGYEDRMGFADTIFPAFLFIVGLSIPLAIDRKIAKGETRSSILYGILTRAFALLLIGFYHVNLESYSRLALLPEGLWELLITLAFFLIWIDYSENISKLNQNILRMTGVGMLIIMAILYKGGDAGSPDTHWMQPEWWGILGIIGWAYLLSAVLYLLFKGNFTAIIIGFLTFLGLNIVLHAAHYRLTVIGIYDGSAITQVLGGTIISLWYTRLAAKGYRFNLWLNLIIAGSASIGLGFLLRHFTEGISKIHSTPSWVLICNGISILMFSLMIYLVDFKSKKNWFKLLWPAGTATLTCYLIPYFQVGFYKLFHFTYPCFFNYQWGGFLRSCIVAIAVVLIGGILERKKLKLKI